MGFAPRCAWQFVFSRRGGWADHGCALPSLLGYDDDGAVPPWNGTVVTDGGRRWADFIDRGNPNPRGKGVWSTHVGGGLGNPTVLPHNVVLRVGGGPCRNGAGAPRLGYHATGCDLWDRVWDAPSGGNGYGRCRPPQNATG
eukprot:gene23619-20366_t